MFSAASRAAVILGCMELSRPPLVVAFELNEKRKAIVADARAAEANARALEVQLALEQFKAPRGISPQQGDVIRGKLSIRIRAGGQGARRSAFIGGNSRNIRGRAGI
jgi:hypothetical protein